MRVSQARKLSCLLEEGTGEADDGWPPRGVNRSALSLQVCYCYC